MLPTYVTCSPCSRANARPRAPTRKISRAPACSAAARRTCSLRAPTNPRSVQSATTSIGPAGSTVGEEGAAMFSRLKLAKAAPIRAAYSRAANWAFSPCWMRAAAMPRMAPRTSSSSFIVARRARTSVPRSDTGAVRSAASVEVGRHRVDEVPQIGAGRVVELTRVPKTPREPRPSTEPLGERGAKAADLLDRQLVQRALRQRQEHRHLELEGLGRELRLGEDGANPPPMFDQSARPLVRDPAEVREDLQLQEL